MNDTNNNKINKEKTMFAEAKIDMKVKIEKITFSWKYPHIDKNDCIAPLIHVEGVFDNDFLRTKAQASRFSMDYIATVEECEALRKIIEKCIVKDMEMYPKK